MRTLYKTTTRNVPHAHRVRGLRTTLVEDVIDLRVVSSPIVNATLVITNAPKARGRPGGIGGTDITVPHVTVEAIAIVTTVVNTSNITVNVCVNVRMDITTGIGVALAIDAVIVVPDGDGINRRVVHPPGIPVVHFHGVDIGKQFDDLGEKDFDGATQD